MRSLDNVDRHILRILRRNARITNANLAAEVGLSASACLRRVGMLERDGVIRGYTALVGDTDEEKSIAVIIQITLERQTDEYFRRFESAVRKHAEIRECYLMTGGADYLLRVNVANAADFEAIHREILAVLPGVSRVQSNFSIRNVLARS